MSRERERACLERLCVDLHILCLVVFLQSSSHRRAIASSTDHFPKSEMICQRCVVGPLE